jgi:hypothetical protein
MIFRYYLPETNAFLVQKAEREVRHQMAHEARVQSGEAEVKNGLKAFIDESKKAFRQNVCCFPFPTLHWYAAQR